MRRFAFALALAATLALAVGACASGKNTGLPAGPTTPAGGGSGGTAVTMPDSTLKFAPQTLTVKVGDTVTWTNDGALPHTVTSRNGKFDSGDANHPLPAGSGTFKFKFTKAGIYPYYCRLHSADKVTGMIGSITVTA